MLAGNPLDTQLNPLDTDQQTGNSGVGGNRVRAGPARRLRGPLPLETNLLIRKILNSNPQNLQPDCSCAGGDRVRAGPARRIRGPLGFHSHLPRVPTPKFCSPKVSEVPL